MKFFSLIFLVLIAINCQAQNDSSSVIPDTISPLHRKVASIQSLVSSVDTSSQLVIRGSHALDILVRFKSQFQKMTGTRYPSYYSPLTNHSDYNRYEEKNDWLLFKSNGRFKGQKASKLWKGKWTFDDENHLLILKSKGKSLRYRVTHNSFACYLRNDQEVISLLFFRIR